MWALANTTVADAYPGVGQGGAQVGIGDVFASGFFIVANAAVFARIYYGPQGLQDNSQEIFLPPATYPLIGNEIRPLGGIKFRNAVAGTPAQVFGAFYHHDDATLMIAGQFVSTVTAAGGVTP